LNGIALRWLRSGSIEQKSATIVLNRTCPTHAICLKDIADAFVAAQACRLMDLPMAWSAQWTALGLKAQAPI
jgi:hypothetical protein